MLTPVIACGPPCSHFAIPGTASSPHPPSVILARPSSPLHMPPPLSLPSSPPSAPPLPLLMSLPSPLLPHEGRVLAENDIMKALLMSPRPSSPHLSTPRSPHHPSPYPTPHSATPHSPISMDRGAMQRQVLTGMKKAPPPPFPSPVRSVLAGLKEVGQARAGRVEGGGSGSEQREGQVCGSRQESVSVEKGKHVGEEGMGNHYLNHHIQPFRPHPFHPHPFHPHPFYPHPFHPHPFHPHPLPVPQVVAEREGASVRQGGG
ncbi:unnamed protein product [Closterium sp. NIES-65]|nr:unnamed protein product [Closterium sp. NIES-65]